MPFQSIRIEHWSKLQCNFYINQLYIIWYPCNISIYMSSSWFLFFFFYYYTYRLTKKKKKRIQKYTKKNVDIDIVVAKFLLSCCQYSNVEIYIYVYMSMATCWLFLNLNLYISIKRCYAYSEWKSLCSWLYQHLLL